MSIFTLRKTCRICNNPNLIKYFDFGEMPLANAFKKPGQKEEIFAPQEVMFCDICANSQLSVVVDPKVMYSNYLYFSSVSKTFQAHCNAMAKHFTEIFKKKLRCVDIASNDGCLLKEFKAYGHEILGIEPAENISKSANAAGIKTICEFWGKAAADKVIENFKKADIVTATNVFAHVDDVHGFVENVYNVLDDEGVFMIEFPYMKKLMENCEFDTIYHEHLSYFLVKPIAKLLGLHHMKIADLSMQEIHGGTIRIIAAKAGNKTYPKTDALQRYLEDEKKQGLHEIKAYYELEKTARKIKEDFVSKIKYLKNQGKKIAAYGAAAKGNVFLNYCRLDVEDINFIVDDTKAKQGLLYAGTRIPIVDFSWIEKEKPDYIVILPWNFAKEIMKKIEEFRKKGGKYIIAIPELKII